MRASDIHLDIKEDHAAIVLRVKGELRLATYISKSQSQNIVGRIKVLSNMRLDITDKSQDGAFVAHLKKVIDPLGDICDQKSINIRAATAPTVFGENIVCRIFAFDTNDGFALDKLGMTESDLSILSRALNKDFGLILVSGPTGSGKTTTLYSCLNYLVSKSRIIVTLEDPVEVVLPHIRQIKVQPEYGFDFSDALKGVLRQDPDVIMVGEIRDPATASLAVQAALTGHLVLATIHAPSALEIIDRLHSLGVRSDMCASVVTLLFSQRNITFASGRKIVFELVEFSQSLKSALMGAHGAGSLSEIVKKEGILLLKDHITHLHHQGMISREDMQKYIR